MHTPYSQITYVITSYSIHYTKLYEGTTGDLWGYKLVRNPQGEVVIGADGLPVRSSEIEYA